MIVFRRRLLYWLIKEYVKRLRKTIAIFFVLGILAFFCLRFLITYFLPKIPIGQKEIIGIVGTYTLDTIPNFVLEEASHGLTNLSDDGIPTPGLASSWEIENQGKQYTFHLKNNVKLSDGTLLTSNEIVYSFSDVSITKPDKNDLVFILKDSYAPFLVTVTKPVFKKGFIGTGEYAIRSIDLNGNFVKNVTLVSLKNPYHVKIFQFYPTDESLKLAFVLGEINSVKRITIPQFKNTSILSFPNVKASKIINYDKLVTIFYNTQDKVLSDKRLRQSLSYGLPDALEAGERSYAPFPHNLWAYQKSVNEPINDLEHAKVLLAASSASESAKFNLQIKTLPRLKSTAEEVAKEWKKLDIATTIQTVDTIPSEFQVFIGDFNVPKDPDQYTLWHSNQDNNITKLKNVRIDKLLEDGRKIVDINQRKKIYADFLKYLLDESPASFLYFPYEYDIIRK